jgi:tetratricopeptide (TPR) repeat protein
MNKNYLIFFISIILFMYAFPNLSMAEEPFYCEDGPRYKIYVDQLKIKYSGKKFEADLGYLSKFKFTLGAEDKTLQKASEFTKQWNQLLTGLAVAYNSCAITKKQFQDAFFSLYPGMRKDSQRIREIAKKLELGKQTDLKEIKQLLNDFLEKLTKFAQISGKEEIINRISEKIQEEHEETRKILLDAIKDLAANIDQPPELSKLKDIAKEMGLSLDDIFTRLEEGLDFDKGLKALLQGRYDDAAILFGKHAEKNQKQAAQSYFYRGNALAQKRDYERAVEAYEQSAVLDPEYSYTWNNWAISLRQLGRFDEAIDKYKEALKHKPENTYALFNWANILAHLNRHSEAIEKYEMASKIHPQHADIWYNWGLSLAELGEHKKATEKFEQAVKWKPDHAAAWYAWGNSLAEQGKHREAIDKYEEAIKHSPDMASAWFNCGLSLFELHKYEEAIQKYQKAVEYNPAHAEALYNWGNILMILSEGKDKTKLREAIEKYKTAIKYEPQHSRAWHNFGATLALLGEYEEAIEKYKMAVKYEPNYPTAWLGWIGCLKNLGRHEEAQEKLDEAKKRGVKLPL